MPLYLFFIFRKHLIFFSKYKLRLGLSSNSATAIFRSPQGYLWVSTNLVLNRDGVNCII
ncbi:MAG: hypothetical protein JZU53_14245 [Paludibacter sp.]|nr:hypothetical protein [Paludibacter sp.]